MFNRIKRYLSRWSSRIHWHKWVSPILTTAQVSMFLFSVFSQLIQFIDFFDYKVKAVSRIKIKPNLNKRRATSAQQTRCDSTTSLCQSHTPSLSNQQTGKTKFFFLNLIKCKSIQQVLSMIRIKIKRWLTFLSILCILKSNLRIY